MTRRSHPNTQPVTVDGVQYPSRKAAARARGVSPGVISRHVEKYGPSFSLSLAHQHKKVPVEFNGEAYESIAAMARSTGIPRTKLNRFFNREVNDELEREIRRQAFNPPHPWHKYCEWQWGYLLHGTMLLYYPSTRRWRWKKQNYTGDVFQFIKEHQ